MVALSAIFACTNGPCRPLKHPELLPTPPPVVESTLLGASPTATPVAPEVSELAVSDGRVLVGRPDGSLQCGMAKGKSPEEMEKDLEGIKVYAHLKRPDGNVHIQVCGSPTGQINVYEIPISSLKDAERRGFKKLLTAM